MSRTPEDWVEACAARGITLKKVGKQYEGPCPICGGHNRFHVCRGSKQPVVAKCRHGHQYVELRRELFPRTRPRGRHRRPEWPQATADTRIGPRDAARKPQGSPGSARERNGRSVRPPNSPNGATGRETASGGTVGCPDCGRPSESDPKTGKRKRCGTCHARQIWAGAQPVSAKQDSPPRRWAALRNLWRPGDPFPWSLRWRAWRDGGGSLVACFAPLGDWQGGSPEPSGVQLIHVAPDGRPRRDRGGLGKRSHGAMSGSVVLMGDPLSHAGRIHVVEGVADALAVAAREDGAVLAAGGTSGFARLSPDIARVRVPVVIWPDGDLAGRRAARQLAQALLQRRVVASLAKVPDGLDPAEMAGSFTAEAP